MKNMSTKSMVQQLGWAKAMAGTGIWQVQMPGKNLIIRDNQRLFREVDPNGSLVIFNSNENQLVGQACVIHGEHNEEILSRHFQWVPPHLEHVQCMLWRMLNAIKIPALKRFYHAVLLNGELMEKFYRAKASHHYHHDYEGGLLEHSFEVASTAASMCRQYNLGHVSVCVAFLAGLLHDLGKINMYYNDTSGKGVCGQHEAFTFMVLAKPLENLRQEAPNIFEALSSAITAKTGQHEPQYLPENIVRMCDRLSMEVSNCKKVFAGMPDYFWYAKSKADGRIYKRLGV